MNFFKDAEDFLKKKQPQTPSTDDILDLSTDAAYTALFNECRKLYENATKQEIERAIEKTTELLEKPYNKSLFMKKLRTYLED